MPAVAKTTPIVFLHGFLGSKQDFKNALPYLEKHYPCYSFDLPGHNGAPISPSASFDEFLNHIKQKLKKKQIPKCHLVGYSMGGRLSLLFAEKYPEMVEKLVIISSHLGLQTKKEKESRFAQDLLWANKLQEKPVEEFLKEWYDQPIFSSLREKQGIFEEMHARRTKIDPKPLAKVLQGLSLARQKPLWGHLRSFPQPILFLCGEKDEKFKALYEKIPPSPTRIVKCLPDAGHAPHLEKPEDCANAIIPFLGDLL